MTDTLEWRVNQVIHKFGNLKHAVEHEEDILEQYKDEIVGAMGNDDTMVSIYRRIKMWLAFAYVERISDAEETDPVLSKNINAEATDREPLKFIWNVYHKIRKVLANKPISKAQKSKEPKKANKHLKMQKSEEPKKVFKHPVMQIVYPERTKMEWRPKKKDINLIPNEESSQEQKAESVLLETQSQSTATAEELSQVAVAREIAIVDTPEPFELISSQLNLDSVNIATKKRFRYKQELRRILTDLQTTADKHSLCQNNIAFAINERTLREKKLYNDNEELLIGDYLCEFESWQDQLSHDLNRMSPQLQSPDEGERFKAQLIITSYLPCITWKAGMITPGGLNVDPETIINVSPYTVNSPVSDYFNAQKDKSKEAEESSEQSGDSDSEEIVHDDGQLW